MHDARPIMGLAADRRLHRVSVAAGVVWASLMGAGVASAAPTDVGGNFSATAAADAVRVTVTVPGGPLVDQVADDGATSAQAALSSLGDSTAFASSAYPGEFALSALGIARGLGVPVPEYPLIASSSHPARPADRQQGAAQLLEAKSGAHDSSASVTAGPSQPDSALSRSQSSASTSRQRNGTVTATARSRIEGLVFGPLVIAVAQSSSSAERIHGRLLRREAAFTITGASIAGQAVTIDAAGVHVAGQNVPLPPNDPVRRALAGAGVTLAYVAPTMVEDGIVSAGLAVTVPVPVSLAGAKGSKVTFVLGRALALAAADPDEVTRDVSSDPVTPSDMETAPAVASGEVGSASTPLTGGPGPGTLPAGGMMPLEPSPQVAPEAQSMGSPPAATAGLLPAGLETYYLGFLLAGLALPAGTALFRHLGVRQPWLS